VGGMVALYKLHEQGDLVDANTLLTMLCDVTVEHKVHEVSVEGHPDKMMNIDLYHGTVELIRKKPDPIQNQTVTITNLYTIPYVINPVLEAMNALARKMLMTAHETHQQQPSVRLVGLFSLRAVSPRERALKEVLRERKVDLDKVTGIKQVEDILKQVEEKVALGPAPSRGMTAAKGG
jgi:hypothetical protein